MSDTGSRNFSCYVASWFEQCLENTGQWIKGYKYRLKNLIHGQRTLLKQHEAQTGCLDATSCYSQVLVLQLAMYIIFDTNPCRIMILPYYC